MKTIIFSAITFLALSFSNSSFASNVAEFENELLIERCFADSDSVKINRDFPVNSFDNRLYQQGIQIGTFDKKTSMKKGQLTMVIQIYDLTGKAVAQGIAAGVNASFAITIFDGDIKLSEDFSFDHEAEEFALLLRKKGKL